MTVQTLGLHSALITTEHSPGSLYVSLRPIQTINARHLQPIAVYFTENEVQGVQNVGERAKNRCECGKTQVSTIPKNKKVVKELYESNASSGCVKHVRDIKPLNNYAYLNDALFQWYQMCIFRQVACE